MAHDNKILHRDIKPQNIIVRDLSSNDLAIVDFGLSCNIDESEDLTATEETVGNRFFYLPETGIGGSDKRDARSDVTLLAGIFYYCLTGHKPIALIDHPHQMVPHRRTGKTIRDTLGDDARVPAIEAFLDRGFQRDQEHRFQTCQEMRERLLLLISNSRLSVRFEDAVSRLDADLLAIDRTSQIHDMKAKTSNLIEIIHSYVGMRQKVGNTTLGLAHFGHATPLPKGIDLVAESAAITLKTDSHSDIIVYIWLAIAAEGMECQLLRLVRLQDASEGQDQWERLTFFSLSSPFSIEDYVNDALVFAREMLQNAILGRPSVPTAEL